MTAYGGFAGTSVSSDGEYVVGHKVVDDGDNVLSSKLNLAAVDGSWRVPVSGIAMGLNPQMSATEMFLAYEEPANGVLHVGTLLITVQ